MRVVTTLAPLIRCGLVGMEGKVQPDLDFNERPFIVIWETTQACDLACVHCRACAQPIRSALELTTDEARRLIDDVAALKAPVFVLTGGDPLKRPDIFELVEYASTNGVRISLTPSATPLLTRDAIARLKGSGLARLAISLDGPTAEIHDAFRRVPGSFEWTLRAVRWARELDLPAQINTTVTRHNLQHLDATIALLEQLDIVLWSVFFLVPTGRGSNIDLISADEFEQVFEKLYHTAKRVPFDIKSTEAQHYRRSLLQRRTEEKRKGNGRPLPPMLGMSTADGIDAPRAASMTAKDSSSCRTWAKCSPAASFRFPRAMCAIGPSPISTGILPFLPPCATPPTCKGSAGSANFARYAEARAPEPTLSQGTCLPRNPAASGSPGYFMNMPLRLRH